MAGRRAATLCVLGSTLVTEAIAATTLHLVATRGLDHTGLAPLANANIRALHELHRRLSDKLSQGKFKSKTF